MEDIFSIGQNVELTSAMFYAIGQIFKKIVIWSHCFRCLIFRLGSVTFHREPKVPKSWKVLTQFPYFLEQEQCAFQQ